MLQPSYIPDRDQRELRKLVRYRKSTRSILEYLLTGESFDKTKYNEMYKQKVIAHNLKATKEQIIDDLNGVMYPLQRRMMKELLVHLDELNEHIKNLDDELTPL